MFFRVFPFKEEMSSLLLNCTTEVLLVLEDVGIGSKEIAGSVECLYVKVIEHVTLELCFILMSSCHFVLW